VVLRTQCGEVLNEALSDCRTEYRFTAVNGDERPDQFVLVGVFEQIPMSTGAHRRKDGVVVEHRQDEHPDLRAGVQDAPRRVASIPCMPGEWSTRTKTA
jgi:hypothetical protein